MKTLDVRLNEEQICWVLSPLSPLYYPLFLWRFTLNDIILYFISLLIGFKVVAGALSALELIHAHNILHLDIKSANILLNDAGDVKLGTLSLFLLNLSNIMSN